jgi:hypothetical protein
MYNHMSIIKRMINSFMHGPVFIIIFGMIFFGIGAELSYKQYKLERDGAQAQGEVISLSSNCDDEGCTYSPVVRFNTRNGISITFESTYSSSPPAYDVGERVTVIYPHEAPDKAEIKGGGKVFRLVFTIVGGAIIAFGLVMFYGNVRDNSSPDESNFDGSI